MINLITHYFTLMFIKKMKVIDDIKNITKGDTYMYFPENAPRDVMEKVMRNRGLGEEDIRFTLDWLEKAKKRDQEAQKKMEDEQKLKTK
jgi:5-bromo-4-chloroindolyl phosphate hydrolysis protein